MLTIIRSARKIFTVPGVDALHTKNQLLPFLLLSGKFPCVEESGHCFVKTFIHVAARIESNVIWTTVCPTSSRFSNFNCYNLFLLVRFSFCDKFLTDLKNSALMRTLPDSFSLWQITESCVRRSRIAIRRRAFSQTSTYSDFRKYVSLLYVTCYL